jgi:hypothetical protein
MVEVDRSRPRGDSHGLGRVACAPRIRTTARIPLEKINVGLLEGHGASVHRLPRCEVELGKTETPDDHVFCFCIAISSKG